MSDYNEITAIITTEEPAVAATLDDLRYLVFEGKKGDTGDSAYEEAVALGFVGTEAEWLASLKGDPGPRGFSPLVEVEETAAGHHVTFTDVSGETSFNIPNGPAGPDGVSPVVSVENITGGHRVTIEDAEHVNSFDVMDGEKGDRGIPGSPGISPRITVTDITGGHRVTIQDGWGESTFDVMDGQSGTSANAVLYTPQTLTDAQKAQARSNIDAAKLFVVRIAIESDPLTANKTFAETYAAIQNGMLVRANLWDYDGDIWLDCIHSDSTQIIFGGDALGAQITLAFAPDESLTRTISRIPTAVSELTNDSGYQTATQVQTAIADKADKTELPDASTSAPVMDGTAAVGTSTDYARADHVHPSDTTRLSTTGNAYRSASIPMGHLDATSTATVMTATVDGITELRDGVCMWLRNGVITSASGFTLNVNGLGAKPCYSSLAAASRSTTIFNADYTMLLIYNSTRVDGGCWDIVYGVDTNTTYTPPKLGFGYGTCTTAAATAAKTASISSYALTAGGIVSIKFDNDVPANATLNISSKGAKAIYFRGAAITAGVIKAGDTATFVYSTYYHLISIDRDEAGDTLPAVTASDNGKFLRVVNGAWAAATVPVAESNSFGGGS